VYHLISKSIYLGFLFRLLLELGLQHMSLDAVSQAFVDDLSWSPADLSSRFVDRSLHEAFHLQFTSALGKSISFIYEEFPTHRLL